MITFLCNPFNDPSSPWYYVVGIIFLLLIFAALAIYILWSGKQNKKSSDEQTPDAENNEPNDITASEDKEDKQSNDRTAQEEEKTE